MSGFSVLVARDLRLAMRQGGDCVMAVAFFILAVLLFPFGVGPEPDILTRIAPGVVLVAALLASLLALERLFHNDYEDGSLDLLILSPLPLEYAVMAKVSAHWLITGLPLLIAVPVLAFLLGMERDGYLPLIAVMALSGPSLSLIGGLGAALTLGARRGGMLLTLLILPLYIPILIFAAGAVDAALHGESCRIQILLLGALLLAALPACPWAAAAALRQAAE